MLYRSGLITGRCSWRPRLQTGAVQSFAPNLITEDRPTVASFLKSNGYRTRIVGKWRLIFQYADPVKENVIERQE